MKSRYTAGISMRSPSGTRFSQYRPGTSSSVQSELQPSNTPNDTQASDHIESRLDASLLWVSAGMPRHVTHGSAEQAVADRLDTSRGAARRRAARPEGTRSEPVSGNPRPRA